jgi:O-antigen ligase
MSSVFVAFLLSCFLSDNIYIGLKKIETMSSLIAFPIACFWFLKNVKLDFNKIERLLFSTFFISNIIFCLVAIALLNFYRNPKFNSKDADFFRNAITDIPFIGDHSIYISLFLAIAIIMGTFIYSKNTHRSSLKILLLLGQFILVSMLLLLMSKAVIIALALAFTGQYLLRQRLSKKMVIISSLIIFLFLLPKENNRFTELFNKESFERVNLNNSTSIRYFILKCSVNLALESPLLGYGLGDVQQELDTCYILNGVQLPTGKYNSHNQYLFIWLSNGLFGLVLFCLYLIYIFSLAKKNKDYFLLSVLLLFMVSFLFENVLSRQSGVVLFSFLINLFILKNLKLNEEKQAKEA